MGTQNGPKLEIWPLGILIHTLQLKLQQFEVSPYVCIGKPCTCNVYRPPATCGAGLRAHMKVTTFTQFIYNWNIGCLLALLCIQLNYVEVSEQFFFLLNVWRSLWKKIVHSSCILAIHLRCIFLTQCRILSYKYFLCILYILDVRISHYVLACKLRCYAQYVIMACHIYNINIHVCISHIRIVSYAYYTSQM